MEGRVGVPMGPETCLRMPLDDFKRVQNAAPGLSFEDATGIVQKLCRVKSPAEIEKVREICRIGGRAFDRMGEIAGTGRPLSAVFRDFQIALLQEGADWVPYLAGGAGPGGYGDVISPPSDEPLSSGDVLMLDTGALRDGYFCDFDRNYAIGQASDEAKRAYETLYAATDAGLALAKPGVTCAELHRAMLAVIAKAGGGESEVGRMGHGLGMRLTEWPSVMAGDETPLEPGMVMTLEPGLEIALGRIMVHEENLVVLDDGCTLLSPRAAPELPVLS